CAIDLTATVRAQACISSIGAFAFSNKHRPLHLPHAPEPPEIALDLARGTDGLVWIVGQLHRGTSIRVLDLADQRDRVDLIVRPWRAALEIVRQVGAPPEAH